MLGLLRLRIGEGCSADVEDMGTERGHRAAAAHQYPAVSLASPAVAPNH